MWLPFVLRPVQEYVVYGMSAILQGNSKKQRCPLSPGSRTYSLDVFLSSPEIQQAPQFFWFLSVRRTLSLQELILKLYLLSKLKLLLLPAERYAPGMGYRPFSDLTPHVLGSDHQLLFWTLLSWI